MKDQNIKTYADWQAPQLLSDFLRVGDIVDEEMIQYFQDVLPPIMVGGFMQISEPCDFDEQGRNTYLTLAGNVFCGEMPSAKVFFFDCVQGYKEILNAQGVVISGD